MSRFRIHLLLFVALAVSAMGAGCAAHRPDVAVPAPGSFFLSSGLSADERLVTETLGRADYILIGETHDSPLHHNVQAGIMDVLARAGRRPLVGLEMVATDRQKVLDRFNRKALGVADLPRALDWENTWGFDFSLYQPVFSTAREREIPVYALNVPQRIFQAARTGKARLSPADQRRMPSRVIPPQKAQEEFLRGVFSMHRSMSPGVPSSIRTAERTDDRMQVNNAVAPATTALSSDTANSPAFARFLRMQSLWDSAMAERAIALHKKFRRPVIILAGSGHVEYGYGIAHRLRAFDPQARIALVAPFAGDSVPVAPVDSLWSDTVVLPVSADGTGEAKEGAVLYAPPGDILFYSPPRLRSRLGMTLVERDGHVAVTGVEADSRAAKAGIQEGQYILRMGDTPVAGLADMHRAAFASRGKASVNVLVEENGRERSLSLEQGQGSNASHE